MFSKSEEGKNEVLPMQQTPKPDAQLPEALPPTLEQSVEL
jgi:hypothetical protein